MQMVKFKDFSRPLSVFQVLFKANYIFKDISRQSCILKYFSSLCIPCHEKYECFNLSALKRLISTKIYPKYYVPYFPVKMYAILHIGIFYEFFCRKNPHHI